MKNNKLESTVFIISNLKFTVLLVISTIQEQGKGPIQEQGKGHIQK